MYKKNYLFALACAAALVGCGEGNKGTEKKDDAAHVEEAKPAEAPNAAAPAEQKAEAAPEAKAPAAVEEKKEEPKAEPQAPAAPEHKEGDAKDKGQGA